MEFSAQSIRANINALQRSGRFGLTWRFLRRIAAIFAIRRVEKLEIRRAQRIEPSLRRGWPASEYGCGYGSEEGAVRRGCSGGLSVAPPRSAGLFRKRACQPSTGIVADRFGLAVSRCGRRSDRWGAEPQKGMALRRSATPNPIPYRTEIVRPEDDMRRRKSVGSVETAGFGR